LSRRGGLYDEKCGREDSITAKDRREIDGDAKFNNLDKIQDFELNFIIILF